MADKKNLLRLVAEEIEKEIHVKPVDYQNGDKLYQLIEQTTENAIEQVCKKNGVDNADFVGLYEDVCSIVKKRILIK